MADVTYHQIGGTDSTCLESTTVVPECINATTVEPRYIDPRLTVETPYSWIWDLSQ